MFATLLMPYCTNSHFQIIETGVKGPESINYAVLECRDIFYDRHV